MNTTNLISTPNITGNIGSCTTQVVSVTTGRPSIFYEETADISTNSCTGQTQEFHSWEFTGVAVAIVVTAVIMSAIIIGAALDRSTYA